MVASVSLNPSLNDSSAENFYDAASMFDSFRRNKTPDALPEAIPSQNEAQIRANSPTSLIPGGFQQPLNDGQGAAGVQEHPHYQEQVQNEAFVPQQLYTDNSKGNVVNSDTFNERLHSPDGYGAAQSQPHPGVHESYLDGHQVQQDTTYSTQGNLANGGAEEGWLPTSETPPVEGQQPIRKSSILKQPTTTLAPPVNETQYGNDLGGAQRSGSVRRSRSLGASTSLGRSASKRSSFISPEGRPLPSSAFVNGAGTTGPFSVAEPGQEIHDRELQADVALSPKQKFNLSKQQVKDNRRLAKIIKEEAQVERKSLAVAIDELQERQRIQKAAVKREAKCNAVHNKSLQHFTKTESAFLAARQKYETAQAALRAERDTLESCRENARQATEVVQEKSQEVDGLRRMMNVDEKERMIKLGELTGKPVMAR